MYYAEIFQCCKGIHTTGWYVTTLHALTIYISIAPGAAGVVIRVPAVVIDLGQDAFRHFRVIGLPQEVVEV